MMVFQEPCFHSEKEAIAFFEGYVWPDGPVCPHCGYKERIYKMRPNIQKRVRLGLYKCGACRKPFTAKMGTIFRHAHLPMTKILMAGYMLMSSKKGMSSLQMKRALNVDYKTAWFLSHRWREALRDNALPVLGKHHGIVEVDETFVGDGRNRRRKRTSKKPHGPMGQQKILSIIDRRTGLSKSVLMEHLDRESILPVLKQYIDQDAQLMTDRAPYYQRLRTDFPNHRMVKHSAREYVSATDPLVHVNTVEGSFRMMKLGHIGIYQHWRQEHSARYVAEYEFRSNYHKLAANDDMYLVKRAIVGTGGKRMTYKPSKKGYNSLVA